jgi:hypothetical protein
MKKRNKRRWKDLPMHSIWRWKEKRELRKRKLKSRK